jgi:chemotaxis protein methyltransferase CheR
MTKNGNTAPKFSSRDYARFRSLLHTKSGLVLPDYRIDDLKYALEKVARLTNTSTADALYDLLDRESQPALDLFLAELTIGETYFFRNAPQFTALENSIFPELIARRRDEKRLRIWSAACSTGEEPYSIAILLTRLLPDIRDWSIHLLASDINPQSLEKAQRGLYRQWSLRQMPREIRERYFIQQGDKYEVLPEIRKMVTFRRLNLVTDPFPSLLNNTSHMDIIFCRNVLIYFDEQTMLELIDRFHQALTDNGWLIVGHAEPSPSRFQRFETRYYPGTVLYQKTVNGTGAEASPDQHGIKPSFPAHSESTLPFRNNSRTSGNHGETGSRGSAVANGRGKYRPQTEPNQSTNRQPDLAPVNGRTNKAPTAAAPKSGHPTAEDRRLQDALKLWQDGQTSAAVKALKQLDIQANWNPEAAYTVAKMYAHLQHKHDAHRWLDLVLRQAPLMAKAHYLQSLLRQEEGDVNGALESLRKALYADKEFVLAYFAYAVLLLQLGKRKQASKSLDNVAELLKNREATELVPEGDGLTVGHLLEMVQIQRKIMAS